MWGQELEVLELVSPLPPNFCVNRSAEQLHCSVPSALRASVTSCEGRLEHHVKSAPQKAAFVTAKGTISVFQKREVDGFYPWQKGLTGFFQGLTRTTRPR